MVYRVSEIMRDVRICLDQNMTSEALTLTGDADTLAFDDIVRSKLLEAVEQVHCAAPVYRLEEGHTFGDAIYWGDRESGHVLLPDDFMRLIVFEMSDWERPVYKAITPADPQYAYQRQRVKALRGTAQKPVCVIATRPEGRVLEFYSCKNKDAYVKRGQYMPYPAVDSTGGIDISKRCYKTVVYVAAALVLQSIGEGEKTAGLWETAKAAMQ